MTSQISFKSFSCKSKWLGNFVNLLFYLNCTIDACKICVSIGSKSTGNEMCTTIFKMNFFNLVTRVVSEPLFSSLSQKTTLVKGVVFDGKFDFITMKFRIAVRVWFRFIAMSTLFFKSFVDMEIL